MFLARGAFLTTDDFTAIAEGQIKIAGSVQIIGVPVNTSWELAEWQLFAAHVDDKLTLIGRRAPFFGADPADETAPVPKEFFAGRETLKLGGIIHDRDDATRPVYCDVKLLTTEFSSAFLFSDKTVPPSRDSTGKHRAPTRQDARDFRAWATALHEKRGYGSSRKEAEKFASERHLNRNWARDRITELPDELRRQRG